MCCHRPGEKYALFPKLSSYYYKTRLLLPSQINLTFNYKRKLHYKVLYSMPAGKCGEQCLQYMTELTTEYWTIVILTIMSACSINLLGLYFQKSRKETLHQLQHTTNHNEEEERTNNPPLRTSLSRIFAHIQTSTHHDHQDTYMYTQAYYESKRINLLATIFLFFFFLQF